MADIVEVVYARADVQCLRRVPFRPGMRVIDAIEQSGILQVFPEIDLEVNAVGVFGRVCTLERILEPGERVEIYRPLHLDPREARRLRLRRTS